MAPYTQNDGGDFAYYQQNHHRGLWAQTATIDWCEVNYELSYYIAEFWNTLSNLFFILPQLNQFIHLSKYKIVESEFNRAFLSLALVGLGSFCFHMTLARPMQMFDETSMILVSLHGFYLLYIIKNPKVNRRLLLTLLILYGLIFLSLYIFLVHQPIFHHTTFGLLVYSSVALGYQLKQRHGPHHKFWTVLILQHSAFAFWLFDKHYCEVLTQFRNNHVPMFLRPLFQFHAIWHLLMGLGSQIFFCGIIRLRVWTKFHEEFAIRYKFFGLWIVMEKVDPNESPLLSFERQIQIKKQRELKKQRQDYQSKAGIVGLKFRKQHAINNNNDNNNDEQNLDINSNQLHNQ